MCAQPIEMMTWETSDLLRSSNIGRLCVVEQGYPLALPVNYRIVGQDDHIKVIVRTSPASVLGRYEGKASLEVDDVRLDKGSAWSVIVRGEMRHVVGTHDLPDTEPLVQEGRTRWTELAVTHVSGRRFRISTAQDGFSVEWQIVP